MGRFLGDAQLVFFWGGLRDTSENSPKHGSY